MRFREGMLGITVVMVAISMGLLGGWALSTDVNDVETTIYNELTEITPLFGSENAPQYTTYNPSSNYTGYYTDNSIIREQKYFDGVDYTSSPRANTYRLNLPPESSTSSNDYDVSGLTADMTKIINYWAVNETVRSVSGVNVISISNLITALNLSDYNRFIITNASSVSDYSQAGTFITFAKSSDLTGGNEFKNPNLTGNLVVEQWMTMPADEAASIILAIDYDANTEMVNTYYDVEMTKKAGMASASEVYLLWGGSANYGFNFGDSIDYVAYEMPGPTYLDPAQGVELS